MTKGRMREFYQCDFDIAGTYDAMIPDAEILSIIVEVFRELEWENITIKINHRKILDGLFAVAGVPADKIRTISSAVDKLDKMAWPDVRREMTEEKGLDPDVADRIGEYVKHKGGRDMVALLRADDKLMANADASKGVDEMDTLFGYLEALGVADKLSFDLSLARGLDYYTGLIYEVVTEGSAPPTQVDEQLKAKLSISSKKKPLEDGDDRSNDPTIGVGSIAAGGRYDNLVGMFSGKRQIPCVGISFGVDRIFSVMKARMEREKDAALNRSSEVDVFVMAFGMGKDFTGLLPERMALARDLWAVNIRTEFLQKIKPKLPQQFTAAENKGIPLAVILGEDEIKQGVVKLKVMGLEKFNLPDGHPDKTGRVVQRASLVEEIKRELSAKRWINYVELEGGKE
jgi:histidyl-tRNA synthetase